jgi:hypothetical protein
MINNYHNIICITTHVNILIKSVVTLFDSDCTIQLIIDMHTCMHAHRHTHTQTQQ